MVNPKDVRVGNWVIKITGTDLNKNSFFEYKPIAVDEYYFTFAKRCFPIPITPAILGNCGFRHDFGDWYKNKKEADIEGGMPFLRFKSEKARWYLRDMEIPHQPLYLHQLQNLVYVLFGEELPIEMGHFKNTDIIGPVNFFIKDIIKNHPIHNLL